MVYTQRGNRGAGRRAREASGHLDHHRRHLQPHGVRRHRLPQLRARRPELRDRVIFVDSLSKTYGMPGWRVGFIAGPESVAKAVTTLNSNHITNLPEVITAAAVAALSGPQDVPTAKCAEFAGKRDQVMAAMRAIPGVVCPQPQGAFYVFPDISVRVRQEPQRHEDRQRRRLLQRAARSQGRRLRAGLRVRRAARDAHLLHLPERATGAGPAAHPAVLRRTGLTLPPKNPNTSLKESTP